MAATPDPRQNTTELESRVVADTPQPETVEQREARRDREMAALWEVVHNINVCVRSLSLGENRSATLPGFSTPLGVNQHTTATASGSVEQSRPERSLPVANPRSTEGLLPIPAAVQRIEYPMNRVTVTTEGLLPMPTTEHRVDFAPNRGEIPRRRVDLPLFEGQNPDDWIFRMERGFFLNNTPEYEKLDEAVACLTGSGFSWWRNSQGRLRITNWKDFQDRFKERFKPSHGCSTLDHLLSIRQQGTVDENCDRFEELSVELPHVTDDVLEAAFLRGLKKSLRDPVIRSRPVDMNAIVDMARLVEFQESENSGYQGRSFTRPSGNTSYTNQSPGTRRPIEGVKTVSKSPTSSGFIPCRHCGDRWFSGHRCKQQQKLKCIEVDDGEEYNAVEENPQNQGGTSCEQED
ncbi:PREDICTED: uncharacterized protein LOC104747909 [Camelina sativa]|uniref:Uncharacterized protein LOC104747909 n=1 Tax=Camelina sativa TaxID=90675 RepID=A0ABM0WA65_CAMSA|nr:PREDICTED: uncharacterized protein LOC104747909 [Camelina sativa]